LLADDPNVPILRNLLLEALAALARGGGTSGALQDEDIALFPDGFSELIRCLRATGDVIGRHHGIQLYAVDIAVHTDDGHAVIFDAANRWGNGIGIGGVDHDDLGAHGSGIAQLVHLLGGVIGGVLDIQRNAEFLGLILCAVAQLDEEGVGLRR